MMAIRDVLPAMNAVKRFTTRKPLRSSREETERRHDQQEQLHQRGVRVLSWIGNIDAVDGPALPAQPTGYSETNHALDVRAIRLVRRNGELKLIENQLDSQ